MLREVTKFYQTSLAVLFQLLEVNQLTGSQYWKAINTLPLIEYHPSKISTKEDLTFLFIYGSVSGIHPEYAKVDRILNSFGIEHIELFLKVRNAMNSDDY